MDSNSAFNRVRMLSLDANPYGLSQDDLDAVRHIVRVASMMEGMISEIERELDILSEKIKRAKRL